MGKNEKEDIEYPFKHGYLINYTLDGVSIHPVTTKIQASFLTQLPERKETAQSAVSSAPQRYTHNGYFIFMTVFIP